MNCPKMSYRPYCMIDRQSDEVIERFYDHDDNRLLLPDIEVNTLLDEPDMQCRRSHCPISRAWHQRAVP